MTRLDHKRQGRRCPGAVITLGLALLAGPCASAADRDPPTLVLVLSEKRPPYTEVADTLEQTLPAKGTPEAFRIEYAEPAALGPDDPRLEEAKAVVGFGTRALRKLITLDTDTPILSTLVPSGAFEKLTATPEHERVRIRAIHLDQPLSRQMALIKLLLPQPRPTVAVLLGPSSRDRKSRIAASARKHGLEVRTAIVGPDNHETPSAAMASVLDGSDVLLAIPDPAVYNRASIRNLLLTTFRRGIPVVGYSDSFVRAGAIAGVVTPIEAIGREAAQVIMEADTRGGLRLPPSRFPHSFRVRTNRDVAKTLEINLPTAASLEKKLREREKER